MPGRYTVRLWNTWQGRELAPVKAMAQAGQIEIALPNFARDMAGEIMPAAH